MRRAVLLAAIVLAAGVPALGQGQDEFTSSDGNSGFLAIYGGGGVRVLRQYAATADFAGGVTVAFRGTEAAGCAAAGVCGVTGTLTWRPRSSGTFSILRVRTKHGLRWSTNLSAGEGFGGALDTAVVVRRTRPDGSEAGCADAPTALGLGFASWTTRDDRLRIGLRGPAGIIPAVVSRCGGPAIEDVAGLLPVTTVPRSEAAGSIVDLGGTRTATVPGYELEARSTMRIRLGGLRRTDRDTATSIDDGPRRVLRSLSATFGITGVSGSVRAELRGARSAECRPLDSCGAVGSVTVVPGDTGGATFSATSLRPAVRFTDLRRALRLDPFGPERRGIQTYGFATLEDARAEAALRRPDGSTCADALAAGDLAVVARADGPLVRLRLISFLTDALRTRCPGPRLGGHRLATGLLPRSALGRRTVTLRLRGERRFEDDGWRVHTSSTLVVRLARRGIDRTTTAFG